MKQQINEIKRMQLLAGIINEDQVNELFGLFGGNKDKKSAPKVLQVWYELEQGADVKSGIYFPATPKGEKMFKDWKYSLELARRNYPDQKYIGFPGSLTPKIGDVYIKYKEVPYEQGMQVWRSFGGQYYGPQQHQGDSVYSHENIMKGNI